MDVPISELRQDLQGWIERARSGDDVVVTVHGRPTARIVGISTAATIARLTAAGILSEPEVLERPRAGTHPLIRPRRPVSPYIAEHRR